MSYWYSFVSSDTWESAFYVLTNVGLLVFNDDNFVNPLRLIPLTSLTMVPLGSGQFSRDNVFKLTMTSTNEEFILAAPNKEQFDKWIKALTQTINDVSKTMKRKN